MTDIMNIGDLARLKRQIEDKDRQIADLEQQLREARLNVNTLSGVNDLLKFQIKDLETMIETWKSMLTDVESNIKRLYLNLPNGL